MEMRTRDEAVTRTDEPEQANWVLLGVRNVLRGYSLKQFLARVAEEYLWWVVRSLPGAEGVYLRYLFLKCTTRRLDGLCWISQGCQIVNGHGLSIGKNFATNRNVLIDALGGIEIGDDVGIGPNSVLLSQDHVMLTKRAFDEQSHRRRRTVIGSRVWIGANCFIKPGVTIGDGAVIGACSNVVEDVPAGGSVIGSPARPLFRAMRELIEQ